MSDSPPAPRRERVDAPPTPPHDDGVSISQRECLAMRTLDNDESYGRSEIAFMFETRAETVRRHCDGECHHFRPTGARHGRQWSDAELVQAFRLLRERVPYRRLTQNAYDDHRPEDFPAASTIASRLGWTGARERARSGGDE